MNTDGSVTQWISRLKGGEASAAGQLWQAYFPRLVGLARHKLGPRPRRLADEEDVALSAFKSLCLGAAGGRFPQLADRDSLWPLLVVLTAHKAHDLIKYERRQKRGGGLPARDRAGGGRRFPGRAEPRAHSRVCRHGGGELRSVCWNSWSRRRGKSPSGNSTATPTPRLPSGWAAACAPSSGGWS